MTISVLRTADAWWVQTPQRRRPASTPRPPPPRELLADRSAIDAAAHRRRRRGGHPRSGLPVTTPCRVVAQMTNFESHVRDSGMDPGDGAADLLPQILGIHQRTRSTISSSPPTSGSSTTRSRSAWSHRPRHPGRHPPHRERPGRTPSPGWSSPTTCPPATSSCPRPSSTRRSPTPPSPRSAPNWCCVDGDDLKRFGDLRLQLSVNGSQRQNAMVEGDMLYRPLQALQSLTRFQDLAAGDLILTGTPAGTALRARPNRSRSSVTCCRRR